MKPQVERRFFSGGGIRNDQATEETPTEPLIELHTTSQTVNRADDSVVAESESRITGYTAVFGVDTVIETYFDSFRERIKKGAFRRALREGQDVRALRNHDPDNLLGRSKSKTLRMKEDDIGLFVEIDLDDTQVGRDTAAMVARGDMSGMSFAFVPKKVTWLAGSDGELDLRIIEDVDLYDVGPVTYPAYEQTSADAKRMADCYSEERRSCGLGPVSRRETPVPTPPVPLPSPNPTPPAPPEPSPAPEIEPSSPPPQSKEEPAKEEEPRSQASLKHRLRLLDLASFAGDAG